MGSTPDHALFEEAIAPLNFIYACSVCCASFADVYKSCDESVQGLSDGINPKTRRVTRLFLASCCHVFCAEHVEGGNPSFHPVGQRPKAPCPVCTKEKNDDEPRDLYSIRGFTKDEYDPLIPAAWFTAPPIRLDGNEEGMDALRFQYLALIRYGQNAYASRKSLYIALSEAKKDQARMQSLVSESSAKLLNLQEKHELLSVEHEKLSGVKTEIERLQGIEEEIKHYRRLRVNPRDLETFVDNKAAIRHYLKLVPMLIDQNEKMKVRLASLGFAMALEPVPNFKDIDPSVFDSNEVGLDSSMDGHHAMLRKMTSSHTAGRSASNSRTATMLSSSPFSSRPIKRKRIEQRFSRDGMPPPPKPLSRMQSVRKMFPSWRKKLSNESSVAVSAEPLDTNNAGRYNTGNHDNSTFDRLPTRYRLQNDVPMMSGALPVQSFLQDLKVSKSRVLSGVGVDDADTDFTFRVSSPLKMNRTSGNHRLFQLPNEPSYMRLMDGLSRETDLELGLKDPRESTSQSYHDHDDIEQGMEVSTEQHMCSDRENSARWSLGHPFLHQAPSRPPSQGNVQSSLSRFGLASSSTRGAERRADDLLASTHNQRQKSGLPVEHVVSSFFKSNHHQASPYSRAGFAEPQDSLRHFGTYQSSSLRTNGSQLGRYKLPSLNGLSFFDSPVNSHNRPIQYSHDRRLAEPMTPSRYFKKRGFAHRNCDAELKTTTSLRFGPSRYDSYSNSPHLKRDAVHSLSTHVGPSSRRSNLTRYYQLPSPRPSAISSPLPPRERQWNFSKELRMRSSQYSFSGESTSSRIGQVEPRSYIMGRQIIR